MPVLSGRYLSTSVNASSPPAEAPMPTIGSEPFSSAVGPLTATGETGFRADFVPLFGTLAVLRFRSSACDTRGARRTLLAGRLPAFFFATHHLHLSLRRNHSTLGAS